ncbi:hypothetical protein FE257_007152 [Aspergillus nanangensis]|uniref:Cytochrome P450 n=1 Tax=Aspergillus nanangensis TaxID=2582783 RepID=A0AAD4CN77_ASPNN|nr:hypothetical protein FE257_007152 [Aspergillus nanangensis]
MFKLEPVLQEKTEIVQNKLRRLSKNGPINICDAFRCLTTEVIMEFAFAKSAGMIEESPKSFDASFLAAFDIAARTLVDKQYWPILRFLIFVPRSLVKLVSRDMCSSIDLLNFANDCLRHYLTEDKTTTHPVVFDNLSSLSDTDKVHEALLILIAGADTTASTLTTGILQILQNPTIKENFIRAVKDIAPGADGRLPLSELENIDYLTACMKESLRLGMAVPGRLPRVVPASGLNVDGQYIPEGTIVGMSAYTMHYNEDIWGSDARSFNPDRWLQPNAKELDQHLCTFSKGARMCIGQNLAMAEIRLVLASIFRNFDLHLLPRFEAKTRDQFTLEFCYPGLPVTVLPIQETNS